MNMKTAFYFKIYIGHKNRSIRARAGDLDFLESKIRVAQLEYCYIWVYFLSIRYIWKFSLEIRVKQKSYIFLILTILTTEGYYIYISHFHFLFSLHFYVRDPPPGTPGFFVRIPYQITWNPTEQNA